MDSSQLIFRGFQDDLPTCRPKAVVFTHFGSLQIGKSDHWIREYYGPIIKSYLTCSAESDRLVAVYAYVDWAIRKTLQEHRSKGDFSVAGDTIIEENRLIGLLRLAEDQARAELGLKRGAPPSFEYVGITNLLGLFSSIEKVDPSLTEYLHGPSDVFTYDSPKFVEAVIRVARGHTPHLAKDPVVRIDEDVAPTGEAIGRLLDEYELAVRTAPIYFFSGVYGGRDGAYDVLNDHAVRTHWFARKGTLTGRSLTKGRLAKARCFLADLSELGATQISGADHYYSKALVALIDQGRQRSAPRPTPQVISGAGLITSATAVSLLPPFMNFKTQTVWVDDHLKRRLHEAIGDLSVDDVESVPSARIRQDRHGKLGVLQSDLDWAESEYFDRLIRGCVFRRFITDLDGSPTNYSTLIGEIIRYRADHTSSKVNDRSLDNLRKELDKIGQIRLDEVLRCWLSVEFRGTISHRWAGGLRTSTTRQRKVIEGVSEDAIRYIKLLLKWHIFVRAVDRLKGAEYWLYRQFG